MTPNKTIQAAWRPKAFFLLLLTSWLLFLSWLWPTTNTLWSAIDYATYYMLNNSLGHVYIWDLSWAILNTRLTDIFAAFLMLAILINPNYIFKKTQIYKGLFIFLGLLIVLLVIRTTLSKAVDYFHLQHASPSVLADSHYSLKQAFPFIEEIIEIKDSSSNSFPGDHASVLFLWLFFVGIFANTKQRIHIFLIGVFFILPRLTAGAHWLSDNMVGGGFVALQTLAWGYSTPCAEYLSRLIEKVSRPFLKIAARMPLLKKLHILHEDHLNLNS